jgi:hypothetical protein
VPLLGGRPASPEPIAILGKAGCPRIARGTGARRRAGARPIASREVRPGSATHRGCGRPELSMGRARGSRKGQRWPWRPPLGFCHMPGWACPSRPSA